MIYGLDVTAETLFTRSVPHKYSKIPSSNLLEVDPISLLHRFITIPSDCINERSLSNVGISNHYDVDFLLPNWHCCSQWSIFGHFIIKTEL